MNLTIPLTPAQAKGLSQATAAYNAGNVVQLTDAEFAQAMMQGFLYELSQRVNSMPAAAFVLRFTADEIALIRAAAESNADIAAYLDLLKANPTINLTDERTVAGVNALEAGGLLAAGRAAEILAP